MLTMKSNFVSLLLFWVVLGTALPLFSEDAKPEKPVRKITPGEVVIPFERMRRIWGELESVDLKTRTGTFRAEGNDEVMEFRAMPYAEMLHHATFGDLRDFEIGERAIFRMHEDENGKWVWLTYIQDEMNMLNGHKEYYFVDAINADKREIEFTQAKFDKSFIREKGLVLKTDEKTQFWRNGKPAQFSDIKVGDALRARTHGVGKGRIRVAWHLFLDDESLLKFQAEQMEVHAKRMHQEGVPGYVDLVENGQIDLTIFQEGSALARTLKKGQAVRIAPAGVDRKPIAEPIEATVLSVDPNGKLTEIQLTTKQDSSSFQVKKLARVWIQE